MLLHYIPMCQAFDFNFIISLLEKSELSTLSTSKCCVIISSEIISVKINMAAIWHTAKVLKRLPVKFNRSGHENGLVKFSKFVPRQCLCSYTRKNKNMYICLFTFSYQNPVTTSKPIWSEISTTILLAFLWRIIKYDGQEKKHRYIKDEKPRNIYL